MWAIIRQLLSDQRLEGEAALAKEQKLSVFQDFNKGCPTRYTCLKSAQSLLSILKDPKVISAPIRDTQFLISPIVD